MPIAPSSKTVQNVYDAVTRAFGDETGAQISQTDIIRWINQGQLELARKNKYLRSTATTPSVAAQSAYNFPGVNIISVEAVTYNDTPLDEVTFEDMQEQYWRNQDSPTTQLGVKPFLWYVYASSINLYTVPQTNGDTIKIYMALQPPAATALADALSIPDTYFDALFQYVMAQAYELDDDFGNAGQSKASMAENLALLKAEPETKYYPTITILADDV